MPKPPKNYKDKFDLLDPSGDFDEKAKKSGNQPRQYVVTVVVDEPKTREKILQKLDEVQGALESLSKRLGGGIEIQFQSFRAQAVVVKAKPALVEEISKLPGVSAVRKDALYAMESGPKNGL